MMLRRRFKQTDLLEHRLVDDARRLRDTARLMQPGTERDTALRQAR